MSKDRDNRSIMGLLPTLLQEVQRQLVRAAGALSHRGSPKVDNLRSSSAGEGGIADASMRTAQISEPEESPETVGLSSQDSGAQNMAPSPGATFGQVIPLRWNAHPERNQQSRR